jgi:glycosyltransferase involved in cell wall biosynthesis
MTIWLDVTTTLGWARPALGIVRVEAETARHFLQVNDPGIRFCRFDRGGRGYFEIDRDEIGAALARLDAGGNNIPVASPESVQHAATVVRSLLARLPLHYRDRAYRFALARRDAFHCFVRACREARAAALAIWRGSYQVDGHLRPAAPAQVALFPVSNPPFGSGDVYISLGLDWDQKDLVYLYEVKSRLGLKVLLFCYDIIPIRFPHLCVAEVAAKFPRYLADVAWCADEILCISDWSRCDLRQFLETVGAPVPTLRVVHLGCEIAAASEALPSDAVAEVLAQRFILFVSTIERRKNHEMLYRAYTRLADEGHVDLPLLVFVGMPGWGVSDTLSDMKLDPRIIPYLRILNHVSDNDIVRLYQGAYFTVYPSLYEGWGLPVAESLSHGKFCLASNAASIPEVGGDLIEYLDPWDLPAWADRLLWYFDHAEEVQRREVAIRSHYQPTAWQKTGAAVFAAAEALKEGADDAA